MTQKWAELQGIKGDAFDKKEQIDWATGPKQESTRLAPGTS